MVAAGYSGIYFDVVDEYQQAWAQSHDPYAEQDMVNLVESLKAYATSKNPNFKVWVNGAEELLNHSDYVHAIGMFKEDLFYTDSGSKQPASETQYSLQYLGKAIAAGKPVVAIEYVSGASKIADVHTQAAHDNIGSYIGHLDLNGIDTDGILPGQTVRPIGTSGSTTTTGSTTGASTSTGGTFGPTGGTSGSTGGTTGSTGGTTRSTGGTSGSTGGTSDSSSGGWHQDGQHNDWQHSSSHSTTSVQDNFHYGHL
jgi:cysteinyl-tRNA synthetase